MQKHENREKDKIRIFTTRSYSNRNTATFANILFPNLVYNRNRERDKIDLSIRSVRSDMIQVNWRFSLYPCPSIYRKNQAGWPITEIPLKFGIFTTMPL